MTHLRSKDVVDWYRGERPRALPISPNSRGDSPWGCEPLSSRFDDDEYLIVCQQQTRKQEIKEWIKMFSNLNGPHGVKVLEDWRRQCAHNRHMAMKYPQDRAQHIESHRRAIKTIRISRFINSQRMAGVARYPFYVEPNTNFVTFEDVPVAEATGIKFERITVVMSLRENVRLFARMRESGRMTGFWSTHDEDIEPSPSSLADRMVTATYLFSDPAEAEKLTEEIIWLKLRYPPKNKRP